MKQKLQGRNESCLVSVRVHLQCKTATNPRSSQILQACTSCQASTSWTARELCWHMDYWIIQTLH